MPLSLLLAVGTEVSHSFRLSVSSVLLGYMRFTLSLSFSHFHCSEGSDWPIL